MTLFETNALEVNYYEESNILHSAWKHSPSIEEFVSGVKDFKAITERVPFQTSLWNISKMDFVISPDLQNWIDKFINVPSVELNSEVQAAFVVTRNMMAQLSVVEMMEKGEAGLSPQYFADDSHALDVLTHKRSGISAYASPGAKLDFSIEIEKPYIDCFLKMSQYFFKNKDNFIVFQRKLKELTVRELQLCRLLLSGRDSKDISEILCITYETVKTHRKNIFRKLGCNCISDLVPYAFLLQNPPTGV